MILVEIDGTVTVAESIGQDVLFPDKVTLVNVRGLIEKQFPAFQIHTLALNKIRVGTVYYGEMATVEKKCPLLKVVGFDG